MTSILSSPALLNIDTSFDDSINQHFDYAQSPVSVSSKNSSQNASTNSNPSSKKRKASDEEVGAENKPKKPRAARACVICRARKVQCDYMRRLEQNGFPGPCTRCADDGQECVMAESKRQKNRKNASPQTAAQVSNGINEAQGKGEGNISQSMLNGVVDPAILAHDDTWRRMSAESTSSTFNESTMDPSSSHVPHYLYASMDNQVNRENMLRQRRYTNPIDHNAITKLVNSASLHGDRQRTKLVAPPVSRTPPLALERSTLNRQLPDYITPLHPRMESLELDYLCSKGSLEIPEDSIRNALLQSYLVWVHPYMPLVDLNDLLNIVNEGTGASGKVSLLLLQSLMFTGAAFVDMKYLNAMGFAKRRAARRAFFEKCRVLYDHNYELDRVSSVQSLLLMTYWYETPDDQKDTWHWMGVAISVAQTIGLHRNPANSNMPEKQKKLWKRIWWSCFMRDRLIALGMRRPTRIKDEDYDVPMLALSDFEIRAVPQENLVISDSCPVARDERAQTQLAEMCVAKAKLSLCISQVLSAQYSVLVRHGVPNGARADVMLIPKKGNQADIVKACDVELEQWIRELPSSCVYSDVVPDGESGPSIFVHRALLHMVYYTTLSALHRPQVLPSAGPSTPKDTTRQLQDMSKKQVREASREITRISEDLTVQKLETYLPTSGVTVLLPAIIIHLLDIKSCNDEARQAALTGYFRCMAVLEKLRDNYASADFATQFLAAAIRKADIGEVVPPPREESSSDSMDEQLSQQLKSTPADVGDVITPPSSVQSYEPLPEGPTFSSFTQQELAPSHAYAFSSDTSVLNGLDLSKNMDQTFDQDMDFNEFLRFDGDILDQGAHGESGGWVGDMSWIDDQSGGQWPRSQSQTLEDGSMLLG